jgi:penicillin-binding protein 1A
MPEQPKSVYSFNQKKKKKPPMNPKKKFRLILFSSIGIIILAFIIYVLAGLPSLEELESPKPQLASKVFSIDGELIGQFYIENRIETDIDSLPQHLINALIATEDRKFYSHWGVDVDRLIKAMIKNIFPFLGTGGGASTITQQLAKNLYNLKVQRENSFDVIVRKVREWITAIQIEKNFTKKEILELYLNVSYFGKSAYGVETAANIYFDKKAKQLDVHESALLIALLKSSVNYDPERKIEAAFNRRNLVLSTMVDAGYLSENDLNKYKSLPIILARGKTVKQNSEAPHFLEYIRQQMSPIAEKHGFDLYRDGLNIYTTLDLRMQKIANNVVEKHMKEYQDIFNKNWNWDKAKSVLSSLVDKSIKNHHEYKEAETQAEKIAIYNKLKYNQRFIDSVKKIESTIEVGFVIMDPRNGQIRTMVGGQNQNFNYGLNHVTQIKRQPGSSFKPFVYTVAVDNGYYPAYSVLNEKFDYNGWSPDNSDNSYGGYMTLREGLAKSVNIVAGRLTISDLAPPQQVIKYAKRMGIISQLQPFPSIALGTVEVSPLEMVNGFSTLANNGIYNSPISILRVEDRNGVLIEEFRPDTREAISPQTASIVVNMMQDVLNYGTGARARQYFHRPAAGKTGTTQDFSDAWFVGFTPQLCGAVWVGFDDRRVHFNGWYGQGARAAMPIWAIFMQEVYQKINMPLKYFELAEDVASVEFCKQSILEGDARLATDGCPETLSDIVNINKMPEHCNLHGGGRRSGASEKQSSGW